MGDPKKQRKKYETGRLHYREGILVDELALLGEYGLRNKKELWRQQTILRKIRQNARRLLSLSQEKRVKLQSELLGKLQRLGLAEEDADIEEILDLKIRDILERRLQTLVVRQGLATSVHQARQLIVHGHIALGNKVVTVPGYNVSRDEEKSLSYNSQSPLGSSTHPLRQVLTSMGGAEETVVSQNSTGESSS